MGFDGRQACEMEYTAIALDLSTSEDLAFFNITPLTSKPNEND
jgi:hypothetical protein